MLTRSLVSGLSSSDRATTFVDNLIGLRGLKFPTGASYTAILTGVSPQSLYLFTEQSGNLMDSVGSAHLTVAGTPTFGANVDGRAGVFYDQANDGHTADVNDLGVASGVYSCVHRTLAAIGSTDTIMGRSNASVNECVITYSNSSVGYPTTLIRDSDAGQLILADVSIDLRTPTWAHLLTLQVDRAAAVARVRISRPGALVSEYQGSIAGFSTVTGNAQKFGFGDGRATTGANSVSWAMVAVGAQCEGFDVPAEIARGLGWEV